MKLNVFIIGLGLIGGSLGLAIKESSMVNRVTGYDCNPDSIDKAIQIGAVDAGADLPEGSSEAQVVFICTPLSSYRTIIDAIRPHLKPGTLVTDVGSTKTEVLKLLATLPPGVAAIGGHPMAGSETRGINAADRYLFENAVYVLTPEENSPPAQIELLTGLLTVTGARIKIMPAEVHDELVATVSHLPHLVAVTLVGITEGKSDNLMMAAGGFRDTTRIASSSPDLWKDIFAFNRHPLLDKLDDLIERLSSLRDALDRNDLDYIYRQLNRAKAIRDNIPHLKKRLLPDFADIICIVPDKPGIIAQLGHIFYQENINIIDIEILRVREGDGGTIRIAVPSLEDADRAVMALQNQAIKAWVR